MVLDGVTLRLDAPQNLRTTLDVLAANEEGGFHIVAAQNVEDLLRVARAGAIVEGKRDSVTVSRSAHNSWSEPLQGGNTPGVDIQAKQAAQEYCAE
jgi:hypothetical protein